MVICYSNVVKWHDATLFYAFIFNLLGNIFGWIL